MRMAEGFAPGGFMPAPNERNLFGIRPELRDPVAWTALPLSGPGQRILVSNTSRVGLRLFNGGAVNILLSVENPDVFSRGWILPPDKEMNFAPPWAPIGEMFAGAAGAGHDLRVWELLAF